MGRFLLPAMAGCALAAAIVPAAEPVVTDSRIISEERRVQLMEAKLASLQREVELLEARKEIERLQQRWGHYISEGMAAEAAALFSDSPVASIEKAGTCTALPGNSLSHPKEISPGRAPSVAQPAGIETRTGSGVVPSTSGGVAPRACFMSYGS